jgi:hypothetical protein
MAISAQLATARSAAEEVVPQLLQPLESELPYSWYATWPVSMCLIVQAHRSFHAHRSVHATDGRWCTL